MRKNIIITAVMALSVFAAASETFAFGAAFPLPQTPHFQLVPQLISSNDSFQVASVYWLPDYLDNYSYSGPPDGGTPEDNDKYKCSTYGLLSSCPSGQVGTPVHPHGELTCYKNCKVPCAPTVTPGAGEQCSEYCQGNCVKKVCKADVGLDANTEICLERCASNSSVCTKKQCKPSVSYDANSEVCSAKCKSNSSICVAKACKPKVSVDSASERCLAYCASDKSVCVSKGCMTSVTVNSGEQCVLYCKSSSSTCVTKSCKDGYADIENYWCAGPQSKDCTALGYTRTTGNCSSTQIKFVCPFDSSEFACAGATTCTPGDIYYSDGTCDAGVVSGKTAVGVVGYVTDSGKHGGVISLEEKSSMHWGQNTDLSCLPNFIDSNGASEIMNGFQNTQCIIAEGGGYPAAQYCNSYKPVSSGIGSTGWYLPAAGELSLLSHSFSAINLGLSQLSKSQISSEYYWSSSEGVTNYAWRVNPSVGGMANYDKTANNRVRCVLAF